MRFSVEPSAPTGQALCPFCQCLAKSSYAAVRRIRVNCDQTQVTLTGIVRSYHEKQLAQECVRQLLGELKLVNAVVVTRPLAGR